MSRIGKRLIAIPAKVEVSVSGREITVKGPKGELSRTLPPHATARVDAQVIVVEPISESRLARQQHGLTRTLVANMVDGVFQGFQRRLEIQGVGYRAATEGKTLILNVGYSNPVRIAPPEGIQLAVENNTNVIVSGINKELVGNTAAKIRAVRPPEPYKGKGIRYAGENVRRKAGKSGKK